MIHPGKLIWNTIMEVWKMIFLCKWMIFRFHVNFQGCSNVMKIRKMFEVQQVSAL